MTQFRMYLLLLAAAISRVSAVITSTSYQLEDNYDTANFASYFDFFTDSDPTGGYVDYIDQATAQSLDLFQVLPNQVYIGVDNTTIPSNTARGRRSIRLQGKKSYNHGLVVLDLAHMPGGQCGTWPAFWMISTTKPWPYGGEIDILEGVNSQTGNSMTMHTNAGCAVPESVQMTSSSVFNTDNCDIHAAGQVENQGCNINSMSSATYGNGFNAAGGGVYVTEWTSDHIAMWYFPRSAIPADITAGNPNPASADWGIPTAMFQGNSGCDIDSHFVDQQIIFDITFCGQWAGSVWSTDSTCHSLAATCDNFVQNHPSQFTETYWLVNSLKVYQSNGAGPSIVTTSVASTSSATPTTVTVPTTISTSSSSVTLIAAVSIPLTANSTTLQGSTITISATSTAFTSTLVSTSVIIQPVATSVTPTTTVAVPTVVAATAIVSVATTPSTPTPTSAQATASPGWGAWLGWQSQARFVPTGGWGQYFGSG